MILYYAAGGCSQASHIALIEAGIVHRLVAVGRDQRTGDGRDFMTINPRGFTPALELDDGTILTESLAILAYIAQQSGRLLPADGLERWRVLEAISFMTTEVHGSFRPLFRGAPPEEQDRARQMLERRFGTLSAQLDRRRFLVGDAMTIADPYLFVMESWAQLHGIGLPDNLTAHQARMREIPSVAQALAREGLA